VNEFFKLLGVIFSLFFGFQFYSFLSNLILKHSSFNKQLVQTLVFLAVFGFVNLIFKWVKTITIVLFKIEPHYILERWIAMFLGILRTFILVSVYFFAIYLTGSDYFNRSMEQCFSYKYTKNISVEFYKFTFNAFYKKVSDEKKLALNKEVLDYYENKTNLPRDSKDRDRKRSSGKTSNNKNT